MRDCGGCAVCCSVFPIEDLDKPKCQDCTHLGNQAEKRCAIYAARPAPCQAYKCLWKTELLGILPADCRPDIVGVVADLQRRPTSQMIRVCESRPGALDEEAGKAVLDRIVAGVASLPVVVAVARYGDDSPTSSYWGGATQTAGEPYQVM